MNKQQRQASAAELREFLALMRGKSPKEMLGSIATSELGKSTLVAIGLICTTVALFTLVPFGVEKAFGKSDSKPVAAEGTAAASPTPAVPEPSIEDADKADAAGKLGIGESKEAPANVNPLESSTDDLLKGLE